MNVDLSRSIEQSYRKALERADQLHASGQMPEAAAVYREAARLVRQLVKYAVSPPEKSRRLKRAEDLEAFAEQITRQPIPPPAPEPAEQTEDAAELQAQIDALVTRADVGWDEIGGLAKTKRQIQLAFGMAVARKPDGVRIDVVRNVLLYGPPGTGKSLLAAAVSRGLAATFFNVSASKVLSKWFGESARLVSTLFATARRRAPSMVFIDELECLFPTREGATTGAERQVLSTLLAELSGLATSGAAPAVFTIGATNAPWLMDSAALSRFGRRIYVPLPDPAARRSVLEIHLLRKGHVIDFSLERLVEATEGLSGRQLAHLAAAAVENMVGQCNPDLAEVAARGASSLTDYRLKTRPIQWPDVEPVLARVKPDTPAQDLRRFESW
jgi:SpoVK/Ycf46/Vps4 family AAA+-type ATPase